jgi:ATP-binding cassette, subfamily G (WHITE), member 2, SNQ2
LIEFLTHARQQDDEFDRPGKKLGVAYKGLTVKGIDAQTSLVKTFPDAILGSLGPDLWRFIQTWILRRSPASGRPLRALINDFTGVVRGGEVHPFLRLLLFT